jgi:hypothetical protein
MTELKELRFALRIVAPAGEQAKRRAERKVNKSEGHSRILTTSARECATPASEYWNPSGCRVHGQAFVAESPATVTPAHCEISLGRYVR